MRRSLIRTVRSVLSMGVYHAVWIVGCVLFLPWLISRMLLDSRYRIGLVQRTGRVPTLRSASRVVWIHGVSVGEVMAAGTVIEHLQRSYPHLHLVISSTTPTGHEVARQQYGQHTIIYFPLDFGLFPGRALDRIAPSVVLLMELEIWPNFLQAASRRGIPVAVINGRISERSFRGYHLVRGLLPELDLITVFCVQDRCYQQRLLELGVPQSKIHVTGNMKYDSVVLPAPGTQAGELRKWLAPDGGLVLVCGSTHGDEDLWLAEALGRVTAGLERAVRLVLAPRHPERVPLVAERLAAIGLACVRWSAREAARDPLTPGEVLLVDTIGQLQGFYAAGDIAFVGGSLVPHGGQNMLEPAALGKAVLFGPHVGNFARDVELLLRANAAVQVRGLEALDSALGKLLRDPEWRRGLGRRAVAVIRENQGATGRTLSRLADLLSPAGLGRGEPLPGDVRSREEGSAESGDESQDQEQAECQDGQGN